MGEGIEARDRADLVSHEFELVGLIFEARQKLSGLKEVRRGAVRSEDRLLIAHLDQVALVQRAALQALERGLEECWARLDAL